MKTLVYHSGALGDFLSILPLLKLWKTATDSFIVLLGKPSHGTLAKQSGLVDLTLDLESKSSMVFFSEDALLTSEYLSEFDDIILFAYENSNIVRNCKKYYNGNLLLQDPFPSQRMHIIDYHYQLIKGMISSEGPLNPQLNVNPNTSKKSNSVILHPGSGSRRKNWSIDNYLQLANTIKKKGFSVGWVKGPAENDLDFSQADEVYENCSLTELSSILSACKVFVGNDSGITHLAAASGCKVIAIYGPSDPLVWAPRGINKISVAYKKMHCSPCHPSNGTIMHSCNNECLNMVTLEDVLVVLNEFLL